MSRWKRLGVVVLIIVASAACVGLGYWQLTRHNARAAQIDLIETNLDAEVVPATDLLGDSLTDGLAPADVWRPVEVRGTWVADSGVQLRNRPVDGANASHALGLLRTESGTLLVVDRGWWRQTDVVPTGALDVPDGEVTLVIRLRAAETGDDRSPPLGQVYWIVPEDVVSQGFDGAAPAEVASASLVRDAYGIVASPRPAEPLQLLPDPDATFGSNLSYAFQWWFFALAIPVAGVILARRAREDAAAAAAELAQGGAQMPAAQQTPKPEAPARAGDADDVPGDARAVTEAETVSLQKPPAESAAASTRYAAGARASGRTPARSGGLRRRRPTLEEEEDALLDAQERSVPRQ